MMLKLFTKYIDDNKLFTLTEKILLGVSGGIDSMVLCDLFLKSGFNFGIAHCNFQLRYDESDGDEQLVKNYANKHNIPFHTISFDTKTYAHNNSISTQMAARDLRYKWFNELINIYNYDKIAVAHHADDKIETFFINLTRGTGLNGLCGMPVRNQLLVRPLLFASRCDIQAYVSENNISYREDSSNKSNKYTRNRIRNNIIPEFEKISTVFKQTMLTNIEHLQSIQNYIIDNIKKLKHDICFKQAEQEYICIDKLKLLPHRNLLLYYILQEYGFKNDTIKQIETTLDAISGKKFCSHTHILIKDRKYFILSPIPAENDNIQYTINESDIEINNPLSLQFKQVEKNNSFELVKKTNVSQFDFDKLKFPLILRKWQVGDNFIPFGMKGRKKLSDYFSDNKYSLFDKEKQWLLISDNDIIWVVGKRIDNRFRVDDNTKTVYQIELSAFK